MPKQAKVVTRQKVWLSFLAILVLALFCAAIIYPSLPGGFPGKSFFDKFLPHLGLDLQGGTHLVYQADVSEIPSGEREASLEGVRDVIERRVNAFGVSEPLVQTGANSRLIVELAGVTDVNDAIRQIGETPLLEFKEIEEAEPVSLTDQERAEAIKYNQEILTKARSIAIRALAGEDFASLASEFSEDPGTKDQGGDLGFAKKGTFVAEFEKALFDDLTLGQITPEPVKTQFGYHIIKKAEERIESDQLEVRGSHILLATKNEEFKDDASADWKNTQLSGKNLKKARVEFDPNTGQPYVSLDFDSEGKDLFAEITKRNLQKPVGIFLDGTPISVPTVQEEITGGSAVISGNFNLNEAKLLSQRLTAGALPVPIELISQQTVGPALGQLSLQKSFLAGLIVLLAVIFFMIVYYRLLGLFAVLALLTYGLISLAIFEAWPVTLTLSGIAGFIVSLGMAVDANILIFERTKEELRNGKPLATGIEEGFLRAWPSIPASNFSSLITCLILTWFSSSIIKGFAIILGIGILISMFTAITVTRTFLRLTEGKWMSRHPWLFGLPKNQSENQ